jgi:hypothetical protein
MKSVLVFNDLWQFVDSTEVRSPQNTQEWIKRDSKALALINLSITHSQLNHVKKAASSKKAWDALKIVFESHGPVRKAVLYKQLLRMEKTPNITMTQKSRIWYLDSGATSHMCNDEQRFAILNKNKQSKVYTAAEPIMETNGTGDVNLDTKLNKRVTNSIKLKDVLCVPSLRNNLLSISSVTNKSYTVTFEKDRATINRKDGSVALTAIK